MAIFRHQPIGNQRLSRVWMSVFGPFDKLKNLKNRKLAVFVAFCLLFPSEIVAAGVWPGSQTCPLDLAFSSLSISSTCVG